MKEKSLDKLRKFIMFNQQLMSEIGQIPIINTSNVLTAICDHYATKYSEMEYGSSEFISFNDDIKSVLDEIDSINTWPKYLNKDFENMNVPYMCTLKGSAVNIMKIDHSKRRIWIGYFSKLVKKSPVSKEQFLEDFSSTSHMIEGTMKLTLYTLDSAEELINRYLLPFKIIEHYNDRSISICFEEE